jgi:hypothetical protein
MQVGSTPRHRSVDNIEPTYAIVRIPDRQRSHIRTTWVPRLAMVDDTGRGGGRRLGRRQRARRMLTP